jgi:hypothetical protein
MALRKGKSIMDLLIVEGYESPQSDRHVIKDEFGSGSIATGRGKLQVQPCPQCPVSDGRPEKGGLSLRARSGLMHRASIVHLSAPLIKARSSCL